MFGRWRTDIMSVLLFLGLAVVLAYCDWRKRTVPRIVCVGGAMLGMVFAPSPWYLLGIVAGVVAGLLADLPMGDVAVGGMLGAWLGVEAIMLTWVLALLVGNVIWAAWEDQLIGWPGEWPFTPLLLVPACAIVLGKGV